MLIQRFKIFTQSFSIFSDVGNLFVYTFKSFSQHLYIFMKNFYFSVMILYKIRQLLVSPIISTYNKFKINVMPKFFYMIDTALKPILKFCLHKLVCNMSINAPSIKKVFFCRFRSRYSMQSSIYSVDFCVYLCT